MAIQGRQLGDLTIARAVEMVMPFDPAVFFPETSPEDWAPHRSWLEPDAMDPQSGALLFPVQSYLVRTPHHTILVDACVGNHKERPNRPLWHQRTDDTYLQALAALEVAPAEVDYVMCTHLHADHVGWNTRLDGGRWVPTFPNARYVFTRKEFEAWQGGHPNFPRQPLEDSVLPVVVAGQAELVTNDFALDDQVSLEPTPGHTPDHVAICLASQGRRAVLSGDLMHSPIQGLHPRMDRLARLGRRPGQAYSARLHGALLRHRYADLHRPLPAAVERPHRGRARCLPLRLRGLVLVTAGYDAGAPRGAAPQR